MRTEQSFQIDENAWRNPNDVAVHWHQAKLINPNIMRYKEKGSFWETLAKYGLAVLVGREYEHFVLSLTTENGAPHVTYLPLPHPSGIAIREGSYRINIASTRNPNQIFTLAPCAVDNNEKQSIGKLTLIPVSSTIVPGHLYIHDLAWVDRTLYGVSAGRNAVVELGENGFWEDRWWPKSLDAIGMNRSMQNWLQLNSMAAGKTLVR